LQHGYVPPSALLRMPPSRQHKLASHAVGMATA